MPLIPITELLITILSALMAAAFGFKIREDTLFDAPRRKRQERFKGDLLAAVTKNITGWEEISLLIQESTLSRSEVRQTLLSAFRDMTIAEEADSKTRLALKELIQRADDDEPFAEIPPTIAVRLDTLLAAEPEREGDIRLLAAAISDIVTTAAKDNRRQKILNYIGFAVGVLGLVVGVTGLIVTVRPTIISSLVSSTQQIEQIIPVSKLDAAPGSSSDPTPNNDVAK
jgi:hypothetical protein